MKLEQGREYKTTQGKALTYMGIIDFRAKCECCGKVRSHVHEFIGNYQDYQKGAVGDWYHYGSECVKTALVVL